MHGHADVDAVALAHSLFTETERAAMEKAAVEAVITGEARQ